MPLALLLSLALADQPAGVVPAEPAVPAVRARARQNPASYVRDGDYPSAARIRHEQGKVNFELAVSPAGRATHCAILMSSGSADLDRRTCSIMLERARFEPARNARNVPVPDLFRSSLNWLISS